MGTVVCHTAHFKLAKAEGKTNDGPVPYGIADNDEG